MSPPISASDKAKARKELADSVGMGKVTMRKMMQIEESAPAPIKEALAKDLISVNKAYGMTKKEKNMPEEERKEAATELLRQDEMKKYRQIDEDSAIAKAVNDALYNVSKIDSSERAVRLWIPCPHFDLVVISRSRNESAAERAAYQLGQDLYCEHEHCVKKPIKKHMELFSATLLKTVRAYHHVSEQSRFSEI